MNDIVSVRPLKLKPFFRLQFEPAQLAYVLLYPEGMVKLNDSAAAILLRCDGTLSTSALIAELEATYGARGIGGEVRAFLDDATRRGWVE